MAKTSIPEKQQMSTNAETPMVNMVTDLKPIEVRIISTRFIILTFETALKSAELGISAPSSD